MVKKGHLFFYITLAVIILDQLTKLWARGIETIEIIPNVLNFTFITNTGAGFGILQGKVNLLIFASLIVIGLILYDIDKILENKYHTIGFSLVLGGAIGNLIDRISFGAVTDFIDFGFWPAFNIADSALVIGIALLVLWWKKQE